MRKLLGQPSGKAWKKMAKVIRGYKMLGISHGTLQTFRVNGVLPFTRVGGIMFYSEE
jgi:hypothetical protein